MDSLLKSSFLHSSPLNLNPPPKPQTRKITKPFRCCLKPDPWSLSSGNLDKAKPKFKNPKNPLSDDNARRIIKAKAKYLSVLRRNQGSRAQTPKWIKRTPEQMVQYLEDDKNGHLYGRHVVAAIRRVRSTSAMREYNMRELMGSFVAKLTFREMCVVLKEQRSWRQVKDFFEWMKLQLSYRPSVVPYTIVLRAYGQAGKIKFAEETFLEMLESGCEPDEVACGTMLCSYARWGRDKSMLSFYSAVNERGIVPSTSVFNFMMSSLQKKSLHGSVIDVWKEMIDKGVAPNQFTYTVVISSLVKEGRGKEAFEALNEMKKLGFVPEESTYSLLISLSSKCNDKAEALQFYEDMKSQGIVPSNFTCASLLALYYRNGDYSKACSVFTEMGKYGVIADEVIYGLMIRIYGKLDLYEDAQMTFEEIKKAGRVNDEKTYSTMAQVHLSFGNIEKALDVMEQMKNNNIEYSRFSFIVLLQCYIMKGDITSAQVTYQALSKIGRPDARSCKDMLNLYQRLGLSEEATVFVSQIRKDQIEYDEELFMTVMKFYCNLGMLREVKGLVEELRTNETINNIPFVQTFFMAMNVPCTRLIQAEGSSEPLDQSRAVGVELMLTLCLKARNEKNMEGKVELLLQNEIGKSTANKIISKYAKEGDLSTTEYLYRLMLKLDCGLEDSAMASVINLYGKKQKLKQALEVFEAVAISSRPGKVIYRSMIDAYILCKREEDAYLFYKEQTIKGHNFDPVAVSILVNTLTCCGRFREAEDVINSSINENSELDTVAYNTFIKAMLEAGKLRFAVSIYEHMVSSNVTPSIQTYNTMISVYGRRRDLVSAVDMFKLAHSMGDTMDEKTYTNLICQYGKAGKVHEASALFSQMQVQGIKPGKVSYNIMMNIYAGKGMYNEAEQLLLSMQNNGFSADSTTYLAIIKAYIESSKSSEAENAIISMKKEGISPNCNHFNLLLLSFTRAGLMEEAERIYRKIVKPDIESRRTMLRGYMDFGHVKEGIDFFEKECTSVGPDRFILSAAVHMYKALGNGLQAKEILSSMDCMNVSFLEKLEVGSKCKLT